jgi:hypothetical protein
MKLGIMQPYMLPYLGYWQAIGAVDEYVVYDDVNYIKGGWVNRNRMLSNGAPKYFTLPLDKMSPYKKINETEIVSDGRAGVASALENAYRKAPHFKDNFPRVRQTIENPEPNLAAYLSAQIKDVAAGLGIETKILISSSDVPKNSELKGQDKVLDICERLGADTYINAIGGMELYDREAFARRGLKLKFVKMRDIRYPQFGGEFVPNLSIVDALMFNDRDTVRKMLNEYDLI